MVTWRTGGHFWKHHQPCVHVSSTCHCYAYLCFFFVFPFPHAVPKSALQRDKYGSQTKHCLPNVIDLSFTFFSLYADKGGMRKQSSYLEVEMNYSKWQTFLRNDQPLLENVHQIYSQRRCLERTWCLLQIDQPQGASIWSNKIQRRLVAGAVRGQAHCNGWTGINGTESNVVSICLMFLIPFRLFQSLQWAFPPIPPTSLRW